MCLGKAPKYTAPEVRQTQETKQAEMSATGASESRKAAANNAGMAGSTLLTGPTGIEKKQLSLGQSTLLGQ
jgi:hypothetical protein